MGSVIVGAGTTIHGEIKDCRRLEVHGVLEANVLADLVIVRQGGGIKGTVHCQGAEIHGVLVGKLVVREHLTIEGTGDVSGEVSYRSISIAAGGLLHGNVLWVRPEADAIPSQAPPDNVVTLTGLFNPDGQLAARE